MGTLSAFQLAGKNWWPLLGLYNLTYFCICYILSQRSYWRRGRWRSNSTISNM